FRDPLAWEFVGNEVIPRILANKKGGEAIRVWSAGCASGEEAYTAAILLAEALGPDAFRERVKIYGTDVDLEALNQARGGVILGAGRGARAPPPAGKSFGAPPRPPHLPQGPPPQRHLWPARPDAGRAHLPAGPAGLPQRPHVLQRRDADPHPRPVPLR